MQERKIMQETKKSNRNNKTAISYMRTATLEQTRTNGGLSAAQQMEILDPTHKLQDAQIVVGFSDLGMHLKQKAHPEAKTSKYKARAIANSKWYQRYSDVEITAFQLYELTLCCPFGVYHRALETSLGRSVFTHEFIDVKSLREEFEQKHPNAGDLTKKVNAAITHILQSQKKGKQ